MRWSALDTSRKIMAVIAGLAVLGTFILVLRLGTAPERSLLFSGLEASDAGAVMSALEGRGINYEVSGTSIFVPADQRDALRLSLAGEGLPAMGSAGYELLDNLSGFSTTSEMFDAAHKRAVEGEIARTLTSTRHFRSARVHISAPPSSPFARQTSGAASATVLPTVGHVTSEQAQAIRHLIASAVPGLGPGDVSVIDASSGEVMPGEDGATGSAAGIREQESDLKSRVERLLEARVGPGNVIVEVSILPTFENEQIFERRIDPDSRIAISMETEQRRASSSDAAGGQVTVASNLPEGDTNGGDRSSNSDDNETRERVNYEISETRREVERLAGGIQRLSVAVLVNQQIDAATDAPLRGEEELEGLRELVASAVGFNEARGDSVTLRAMEFMAPPELVAPEDPGFLAGVRINPMQLIQLGIVSGVTLILGLFVLRPILTAPPPALVAPPAELPGIADTAGLPTPDMQVLPPLDQTTDVEMVDFDIDSALGLGAPEASDGAEAVERLNGIISENESEAVEVLRSWMVEGEPA